MGFVLQPILTSLPLQCHSANPFSDSLQRYGNAAEALGQRTTQAEEQRRGALAFVLPGYTLSGANGHWPGQRRLGHIPSRICGRVRQADGTRVQHVLSQSGPAAIGVHDLLSGILQAVAAALTCGRRGGGGPEWMRPQCETLKDMTTKKKQATRKRLTLPHQWTTKTNRNKTKSRTNFDL